MSRSKTGSSWRSPGLARRVRWSPRARVDAALDDGQHVDPWYDPLLGKIVVHGATREDARISLHRAKD